ncbi:hypothetical protein E2C01_013242 [Portunus trituberculatus]|uniref:Uncharacterized protein n=1 Tax=Portunus trituberculatus TaxID=210409 RepID=A0A5B7DGE6_PORTR|nr:hypothetical protein [Portunus trituberculatus]
MFQAWAHFTQANRGLLAAARVSGPSHDERLQLAHWRDIIGSFIASRLTQIMTHYDVYQESTDGAKLMKDLRQEFISGHLLVPVCRLAASSACCG